MDNVLTMLFAEGKECKLSPLCRDRSISAMPFGGRYLVIDFVLSNFVNSGFYKIKVLTQYRSEFLIRHLRENWNLSPILGHHIELVPPQMKTGSSWYNGSADAVYQNLNFLQKQKYDHVCVFRSDIIYKMNVLQMYEYHKEIEADATLAVIPVPINYARNFGVVEVDKDYRILSYEEKPQNPKTIPGEPEMAFASMGNYIFNTDTLVKSVTNNSKLDLEQSLNNDILPRMINKFNISAYNFNTNRFPGITKDEIGYWARINNIDSYWSANMGLVSISPILNLYDLEWPIRGCTSSLPPAKFVFANEKQKRVGIATDSIVSEGCILSGGSVNRSVLFPKVRINSFSKVTDSVLMEGSEIGRYARVKRAIIENFVKIPQGMEIGYNLDEDRKRFSVSPLGIVVVTRDSITKAEQPKKAVAYIKPFIEDTLNIVHNAPSQSCIYCHDINKEKDAVDICNPI